MKLCFKHTNKKCITLYPSLSYLLPITLDFDAEGTLLSLIQINSLLSLFIYTLVWYMCMCICVEARGQHYMLSAIAVYLIF